MIANRHGTEITGKSGGPATAATATAAPVLILLLATAGYLALIVGPAITGFFRWLKLLLLQYAVLLPAILYFLRVNRRSSAGSQLRWPVSATILLLVYGALTLPLAWFVRQGVYSADETTYRFQARLYLSGSQTTDAPPVTTSDPVAYQKEFHFWHHIIHNGKWFGKYPPGWPAILAVGTFLRADWLLNPLFGLMVLWISERITHLLFSADTAKLAVAILLLSPYYVFNNIGYMSHPSCAAFIAAATLFLFHGTTATEVANADPVSEGHTGSIVPLVAMLVCLAIACLIRPFTAIWTTAVLGISALWTIRRDTRRVAQLLASGLLIGGATLILLVLWNWSLTGSYLQSPYALEPFNHPRVSFDPRDILKNASSLTWKSLAKTAFYSFPFIGLLAAYALWCGSKRRKEMLILATLFGSLVVGYLGLQFEGSDSPFGERYYSEAYFAVAILAAKGCDLLYERWKVRSQAIAAIAIALIAIQSVNCALVGKSALLIRRPYARMQEALEKLDLKDIVVFVDAPWKSPKTDSTRLSAHIPSRFWASDFNPNAADWKHAPIFCMPDPGPVRRTLIACRLKRLQWMVASYDPAAETMNVEVPPTRTIPPTGTPDCP